MSVQVVKVQRPVRGVGPQDFRVRSQDGGIDRTVTEASLPKKLFKFGEARAYAKAFIGPDGNLMITERAGGDHRW